MGEGGCLADLKPEYIKGVANWQQGRLSITQFEPDGSQFLAQAGADIEGQNGVGREAYQRVAGQ